MSIKAVAAADPAEEPASRRAFSLPAETGVAIVLLVALVWLSAVFPTFRTQGNLNAILGSAAEVAIVAAGMTLVIATGGIDISVGSITGFCGIVIGILSQDYHWNVWAACAAGAAAGGLCGLVNGTLISRFRVPPIIATLAMFSAARAGAYVLSRGDSISGLPDSLTYLGYNNLPPGPNGLPIAAWIAAAALLAVGVTLKKTAFGRSVKAMGGNRVSAYLSGVRTARVETLVYAASGLLAGIASVVVTARGATAIPDAGKFYELRAITAVVLGGTSVAGGQATIIGTLLGVITIGVVGNGVRSYGKAGMWEQMVLGLVLLAAVEVDRWRTRRNQRARAEIRRVLRLWQEGGRSER